MRVVRPKNKDGQRGLGHPFPWEGKGVAALSLHLPSLPPLGGGGGGGGEGDRKEHNYICTFSRQYTCVPIAK